MPSFRTFILAAASAAALSACDTMNDPFGAPPPPPPPGPYGPQGMDSGVAVNAALYVDMAASGDMYERESARLALQRSTDPRHREFAQVLLRDHGGTTAQLVAAARAAGIAPPARMQPMHVQMLDELRTSTSFDATFHQQQVRAHQMALDLHESYARRGDRDGLRAVASTIVPVIRMHLEQMEQMR